MRKRCWRPLVPSLLELQRGFMDALHDSDAPGPLAAIRGNGLAPEARLRIYRHSGAAIHAGALRTTYPAVLALVGEDFFEQTARGYRAAQPSRSGNLQAFGDRFADYLATLPAVAQLAYLPDVARLEWLRQQAALTAVGDARDALHPSVRLFASAHAVLSIWRYAMQPDGERFALPPQGERVLLWREDAQVAMAALDPASFACVAALARGGSLDAAYRAGCMLDPDFNFAACIESLVDRGLLTMRLAHVPNEETDS